MNEDKVMAAAQGVLEPGEEIEAVGVFEIQNDYKAMALAGGAAGAIAPGDNPAVGGLSGAAALEGVRQAEAAHEGVTPTMGLAVTNEFIRIFAMSELGESVGSELMRFNRDVAHVEVKKLGFNRHIRISDPSSDQEVGLNGASFGVGAKGDKAVLALLTQNQ
jgi:hypothetical protein